MNPMSYMFESKGSLYIIIKTIPSHLRGKNHQNTQHNHLCAAWNSPSKTAAEAKS